MKRQITVSAKSVEEALQIASVEIGVPAEEIKCEVVAEPKKGFLGIGSVPGEYSCTYGKDNADKAIGFLTNLLNNMGLKNAKAVYDTELYAHKNELSITMPIPDALVQYGGNNRVGAVNGNTLEDLGCKFTTVDGIPCVTFTATHFSPYTIYVDTSNLSVNTLDSTPKTGDGIHPKWFVSIALACISLILFMKKDKVVLPKKVTI